MPYLDLADVTLWYSDFDGEPKDYPREAVLFVHADTGSGESWAPQTGAFQAAGYRCITYDQRGRGRSRTPLPVIPAGSGAADLLALLDHLGLESPHIVATALGAFEAISFASRHPDRVGKLVLANTAGGISDPWYREIIAGMWTPQILALPSYQLELSPAYRGQSRAGTERWIEVHNAAQQAGKLVRECEENNTFADLGLLLMPVLLIAGDADLLAPPALMRHLANAIRDCEFKVIPDTGHSSSWEAPSVFNEVVLKFLAGESVT